MKKLTEKQAFAVMIYFLDQYYQQTQADDIAALLGNLHLLSDGMPADPAIWDDWLIAIEKILPDQNESLETMLRRVLREELAK